MDIFVDKVVGTDQSTISKLTISNNPFTCFILEDTDRGLKQSDSLESIKLRKKFAQTAIPAGKYELVINYSNRFQKFLPQLLKVPGFEGIRIHPGNAPADTEGCLLPGMEQGTNSVIKSMIAFNKLMNIILPTAKKEKIFVTINR